MMYGSSSDGYGYSPDRRNDRVNHDNLRSPLLGASGSRQGGFYYSPKSNELKSGEWKQSGSGAWYKD